MNKYITETKLKNFKQVKKIVLCHGVFDLFHVSHLIILMKQKDMEIFLLLVLQLIGMLIKVQVDLSLV